MRAVTQPRHLVLRSPGERLAHKLPLRAVLMLGLLLLALFLTVSVSLATGSYGVALGDVLDTLRGISITKASDNPHSMCFIRIPRLSLGLH